ncbi:MAG: hypothetical protein WCF81_23965 [Roseiarcus sp.]
MAARSINRAVACVARLPELRQLSRLLLLFGDPRRIQIVVAGARVGGGLFNQ